MQLVLRTATPDEDYAVGLSTCYDYFAFTEETN